MKHTASVSVADQQVDEIENDMKIFFVGIKRHEASVDCKRILDIKYARIPENKRLDAAREDGSLIRIMNSRARIFKLVERV